MSEFEILDGDELLALARIDIEAGRLDGALLKVKWALKKDNSSLEAISMSARLYAQLRLTTKAVDAYKLFLQQRPEAMTETFQLGMVHMESGMRSEALSYWTQVLEADPAHPPSLYFSAIARLEQGEAEAAQRHLNVLLNSASVDNLYYSKAKDLLLSLERNRSSKVSAETESRQVKPEEVYN